MWTFLKKWLLSWLVGEMPSLKPSDIQREEQAAKPEPEIQVVGPVLRKVDGAFPWYYTPKMAVLLALIRKHESGKASYNADYRNDDKWTLNNYSLDEVIGLAKKQVSQGEPSSAIGGYQFLSKTLLSLKESLKLEGSERFTPFFQDDLAIALMIRRGLLSYLRGEMKMTDFMLNLAKEWASLPVPFNTYRGKTLVKRGQSYYAGDGLNKSFHTVEAVMSAVSEMALEVRQVMPSHLKEK
jgi:muramidase (phage lysozyme)